MMGEPEFCRLCEMITTAGHKYLALDSSTAQFSV